MNIKNNPFLIVLIIVLAGLFVWYFKIIFIYLLVSAVLTLICQPLLKLYGRIRLGSVKLPRFLIAFMTLLTLFLVIAVLISIFIPPLVDEAGLLSSLRAEQVMVTFSGPIQKMEVIYSMYSPDAGNLQSYLYEKIATFLNFTRISGILNSLAAFTGDLLAAVFSVLFITFFFLKDENLIYEIIISFVPDKYEERVKRILNDVNKMLTRYFLGISIQLLIVVTFLSIGFSMIGIKNAIIIALFYGILNIIPYIGPLIGILFGLIVGASTTIGMEFYTGLLPVVLKMLGIFGVVYALDSILIAPFIFSSIVKAHPLEIFIVILFAGTLAGIPAMIVAIPSYMILRIIAREFFEHFRLVRKITREMNR